MYKGRNQRLPGAVVSADSKNEFSSILWSDAFPFLTLAMVIQMYTFAKIY